MKRWMRFLSIFLACCFFFLLGWRVMPRIWPTIKTKAVYRVFPGLKPTIAPQATPAPYVPESDFAFGDEIQKGDSVVYYFYKEYCPYCVQLEPLMAGLPESITLASGETSDVKLICLNKSDPEMGKVIADYYAEYEIPEEEQYVPAVVVGEKYWMPGAEIIDNLMDALVAGEGVNTPNLSGERK